MCGNTIQPHIPPIRAFSRGKSVRNAYGKYGGFTTKKGNATVVLVLQLDFPFGSSVQVHHPTSYTASSGVFPRRIRTECVREVKRFHNEKGKGNCSTSTTVGLPARSAAWQLFAYEGQKSGQSQRV